MDILSTIYSLTKEYELKSIKELSDDKLEILMLRNELNNIRANISSYVKKIYPTGTKEVQDILDNICLRVGIKNNKNIF